MTTIRTVAPPEVLEASFVGGLGPGTEAGTLPPPTFAEIAFAGRSNVGKSSLINTLVERKGLVRTSSTPGCTRQVNLFEVKRRDGVHLVFADLPGYGFAKRSKQERSSWAALIEGYLATRTTLRVLVLLMDARRGLEEDDLALVDFATRGRRPDLPPLEIIVVATKVDKLPRSSAKSSLAAVRRQVSRPVVGFSAVTGDGRPELWRAILKGAIGVSAAPEHSGSGRAPGNPA
jgi:GTP-binding protein